MILNHHFKHKLLFFYDVFFMKTDHNSWKVYLSIADDATRPDFLIHASIMVMSILKN